MSISLVNKFFLRNSISLRQFHFEEHTMQYLIFNSYQKQTNKVDEKIWPSLIKITAMNDVLSVFIQNLQFVPRELIMILVILSYSALRTIYGIRDFDFSSYPNVNRENRDIQEWLELSSWLIGN